MLPCLKCFTLVTSRIQCKKKFCSWNSRSMYFTIRSKVQNSSVTVTDKFFFPPCTFPKNFFYLEARYPFFLFFFTSVFYCKTFAKPIIQSDVYYARSLRHIGTSQSIIWETTWSSRRRIRSGTSPAAIFQQLIELPGNRDKYSTAPRARLPLDTILIPVARLPERGKTYIDDKSSVNGRKQFPGKISTAAVRSRLYRVNFFSAKIYFPISEWRRRQVRGGLRSRHGRVIETAFLYP